MNRMPPQAISPLRERLTHLRAQLQKTQGDDQVGLLIVINETEALIKRLENPNVPRTA